MKDTRIRIYLSVPISGSDVNSIRERVMFWKRKLKELGFFVFHPFLGEKFLRPQQNVQKDTESFPSIKTDKFIFNRDLAMIDKSDWVLVDLRREKYIHKGCIFEMGYAFAQKKHIILVIEDEGNPNDHAFIRQAAGAYFSNPEDALNHLEKMTSQKVDKI